MNYILLNNLIFNHQDTKDYAELRNGIMLSEKFLDCSCSCYCDEDYQDLIDEIYKFLSNKTDVVLIVGTFFYRFPCFVKLLSARLSSVKIAPLVEFFGANQNMVADNEEFVLNEVYNHFVFKTTCNITNKTLKIISQKLEHFDFEKKLLESIDDKFIDPISDDEKFKCININQVSSLNKSSENFDNKDDYNDDNCGNKMESTFTLLLFYNSIVALLKKTIVNNKKQLIFNTLLYLKDIEIRCDGWATDWFNLSSHKVEYQSEQKIQKTTFETDTLPVKNSFSDNHKFWLLAESANFACNFSRTLEQETKTGKLNIPRSFFSNKMLKINNQDVTKILLEINKDSFNNLHIDAWIDNKLYYTLIDFNYE
jgi:hypothetical protein